jgi:hypothetical protein
MKKKNAQTQSLLLQIWEMLPSATWPHLPISICICQGKMIRGIPIFFVEKRFHLQYLTKKKNKTSKADHFSSKYGDSKLEKNSTIVGVDTGPPSAILFAKETW